MAPVGEAFIPTKAEIAWAREITAAAGQPGAGAARAGGQMADEPVVDRALRILARAAGAGRTVTSVERASGENQEG